MSKNAIILYYEGLTPPQALITHIVKHVAGACKAELESIVVKHYDEDSIVKVIGNDAVRKIHFEHGEPAQGKEPGVNVRIKVGSNKLKTIKYIKETLHLPLNEAKQMVDEGVIIVPSNCCNVYEFVSGLNQTGSTIIDTSSEYATTQAAYFINKKYCNPIDHKKLLSDYALAAYHSHVNTADEEESALLNAVEIIQQNSERAATMIGGTILNVILCLKPM